MIIVDTQRTVVLSWTWTFIGPACPGTVTGVLERVVSSLGLLGGPVDPAADPWYCTWCAWEFSLLPGSPGCPSWPSSWPTTRIISHLGQVLTQKKFILLCTFLFIKVTLPIQKCTQLWLSSLNLVDCITGEGDVKPDSHLGDCIECEDDATLTLTLVIVLKVRVM